MYPKDPKQSGDDQGDSRETPHYEAPYRGEPEGAYKGSLLQYALAIGLIVGLLLILKALDQWTPGPADNRTYWQRLQGK